MKRTLLILALVLTCLIPGSVKADTGITDVYLIGPGGSGGTSTVPNVNSISASIGTTAGGVVVWEAQSFTVSSGLAAQFTVVFNATTGAPTGTVTWRITSENVSVPGTTIETGTFTPTANATNVITLSSSNFLSANTTYFLELKSTNTQANGVFWTIRDNNLDQYANGMRVQGTGPATWGVFSTQDDVITVTMAAGSAPANTLNDKLAQSFTVGQTTVVSAVNLNLKKFGSPTGTLTLTLESDAGQMPSGTVAITGASVTVAESSLTTSYAQTAFTFSSPITLRPGILYWLDLTTDRTDSTQYVAWGATGVCTGQYFRNHVNGAWQLEQYIGTFSLTISSLSPPQASQDFVTLTDGAVGTVNYSITGGEAGLFGLGIIFLIVMIFGIFQLRKP